MNIADKVLEILADAIEPNDKDDATVKKVNQMQDRLIAAIGRDGVLKILDRAELPEKCYHVKEVRRKFTVLKLALANVDSARSMLGNGTHDGTLSATAPAVTPPAPPKLSRHCLQMILQTVFPAVLNLGRLDDASLLAAVESNIKAAKLSCKQLGIVGPPVTGSERITRGIKQDMLNHILNTVKN